MSNYGHTGGMMLNWGYGSYPRYFWRCPATSMEGHTLDVDQLSTTVQYFITTLSEWSFLHCWVQQTFPHLTVPLHPHLSRSLWSDTWPYSLTISGELSSSHPLWDASDHALTRVYVTLLFHLLVVMVQRNLYLIVTNIMGSRTTERKRK